MAEIIPTNIISLGEKLNPVATKILIAVPVLLACVALARALVVDVATAIIGSILTIVAAVLLYAVISVGPQLLGTLGIWLARFCLIIFCVVTTILITSWGWNFPRPTECLIHLDALCSADFRKSDAFSTEAPDQFSKSLQAYLFPSGGIIDHVSEADFERAMIGLGCINLSYSRSLYDPQLVVARQYLVENLVKPRGPHSITPADAKLACRNAT
jgi:hypothetical protein